MMLFDITSEEMKQRGYDSNAIDKAVAAETRLMEFRQKAIDLEKTITATFPDSTPRPMITRSVAMGYDNEHVLSKARGEELATRDPEQKWTEVPDAALSKSPTYFGFSDDAGWLFYLPAFMCHCLRTFQKAINWDLYSACTDRTHIQLLNEAQLRCLDLFVAFCDEWNRED